jgi:tetratricopeptide (TPR) repeat protein
VAFLKRSGRQYTLIGVAVLLLIPLGTAAFAPLLAPVPSQAAGWSAPPLPERDEPLPDFQHLLDPLPLIVRDLPDAASRQVVTTYDAATLTDHQTSLELLEAAEQSIPVPSNLDAQWNSWLNSTMNVEPESEPAPIPDSILTALQGDPQNGDRLSNLAVAMYFVELTAPTGQATSPLSLIYGPLPVRVLMLLHSTMTMFPESRGATLNFVALSQVFQGGRGFSPQVGEDVRRLRSWLDDHPDDATALLLLLQLHQSQSVDSPDRETVRTYIARFADRAAGSGAALAHVLSGDLLMVEVHNASADAPFAGRQIVLQALEEYDKALQLSDDSSIYTARAMALEQLGDIPSAIRAQQRALELHPESVTLHLRLTQLYLELRGDEANVIDAVQSARSLSRDGFDLAKRPEGISLSEIGLRNEVETLDGFAFRRPERYFLPLGTTAGGAGGSFVSFDSIPVYENVPVLVQPGELKANSPLIWAAHYAILCSVILGDPGGVEEDLEGLKSLQMSSAWRSDQLDALLVAMRDVSEWTKATVDAAGSVSDPENFAYASLDYFGISIAVDAVRYAGLPQRALAICRSALETPGFESKNDNMSTMLWTCIAENAYLAGDYETSQRAFETLGDDLMSGYVAERRGSRDEAEERYRREMATGTPDAYLAMLRLADMTLQEDPAGAIETYNRVIGWAIESNGCGEGGWCVPLSEKLPLAYGNRGVARLQVQADRNGNVNCDGEAWEACTDAFLDFSTALESDPYNPVFLMNQAWAARLLGDQELSAQLMDQALESDTSLYPVLNDLGVFAMESGDSEAASQYFQDAVAANPHYDLAWWNLGVLHMREGIGGIFRGQAYLARAIVQNPSLVTGSLEFRTDERFYRVEINEQLRPGAGWTFGTASSVATTAFGLVTMMVVIFYATYLVVRDKLLEILHERVQVQSAWMKDQVRGKFSFTMGDRWTRWLPVGIALAVLAITTIWIARNGEPHAASASAALALFAVVLAVVVHEMGHALAAWRMHATIEPTQWVPGTVLALVLLPLGVSSGPYPGQKIAAGNKTASKWIYLAGPVANLAVAVAVYLLYVLEPLPGLRLISQVQLAAMSYALLPFAPLDGAVIAQTHRTALAVWGAATVLVGVLFGLGWL